MPGAKFTHIEIPADDLERAKRFYAAVAGWEFQAMEQFPDYELFQTGEETGGAIGTRGGSAGTTIRNFITIPDLERATEAVNANGGRVVEEAVELPGQGRYIIVHDSEGNEIVLWQDLAGG